MGDYELRIGVHSRDAEPLQQQGKKTPTNYDRGKALAYALFFCNRVCSDGVVMAKTVHHLRKAGALLSDVEEVPQENDCTHFVSSSMGLPPPFETPDGVKLSGGGMHLDEKGFYKHSKVRVYGMLEPKHLADYLRMTNKAAYAHMNDGTLSFDGQKPQFFSNDAATIASLRTLVQARFANDNGKGDLIIYYDENEVSHHSALLVTDAWGIVCHSDSRCGSVGITDVGWALFSYMRIKQFREDVL